MAKTLSSTERELLAGLLGFDPCSVAYQRLEGSSHNLLRFTLRGDLLVARWPKIARPGAIWWRELSVQQLAAQHGLAPHTLALQADNQSALLRGADPLRLGLREVAKLLQQCHQLPKVSQKLDIAHAFRYWFESCQHQHRPWAAQANQQKAEHAAQKFSEFETRLVQSHGDCVATNVLQLGNRVVLIDWEYHCLAPRWWDLAIYAESQQLNSDATHDLLQNYCQAQPSRETRSQLKAFRTIYAELAILWHCATMHAPNHYQTP